MIIGQFINRKLSLLSGSTLQVSNISASLGDFCDVELFSKDSNLENNENIRNLRTGNFFIPKFWPKFYANNPQFVRTNKFIRSFQKYSVLREGKFDILHCHGLSALEIANVYDLKKPIIFDYHGLCRSKQRLNSMKKLINKADAVIGGTKFTCAFLAKKFGVDPKKIFVVPPATDISLLESNYSPEKVRKIRANLNINSDIVLMYIGNFALFKLMRIANIVKSLNDKGFRSKFTFLVITGSEQPRDVRDFIIKNKLDNLIFHQPIPYSELFNYMRLADILYVPRNENDLTTELQPPGKWVTCLSSGVATIIGSSLSSRDLINDYKTAVLAKPEDYEDYVSKTIELMDDKNLRLEIGNNGKEYAKVYTWDETSRTLVKIYKKIINAHSKST